MIVAKNCYFWSVFPQISCGGYPQNSSKFPKPHFLLTCTYFGGRRHGRNLPMAKATDGLAFGITRHCRIEARRPSRRPGQATPSSPPPHLLPTPSSPPPHVVTSAFSVTAMGVSISKANIGEHRGHIGAR